MRLPLLLALTLALPATASASSTYSGCGTTFNTCASASLNAVQRPDGTWRVTVTVRNLSYSSAQGADRSAVLWGVYLTGIDLSTRVSGGSITGPDGLNLNPNYATYGDQGLPGGPQTYGAQGYRETIDENNNTIAEQWTGIADPRCAADPACAATRLVSSPNQGFLYVDGAVTFTFDLSSWSGTEGVQVETFFYGNQGEIYDLQPQTVTPEPGTMILLGTGIAGVFGARRRRRKTAAPDSER